MATILGKEDQNVAYRVETAVNDYKVNQRYKFFYTLPNGKTKNQDGHPLAVTANIKEVTDTGSLIIEVQGEYRYRALRIDDITGAHRC